MKKGDCCPWTNPRIYIVQHKPDFLGAKMLWPDAVTLQNHECRNTHLVVSYCILQQLDRKHHCINNGSIYYLTFLDDVKLLISSFLKCSHSAFEIQLFSCWSFLPDSFTVSSVSHQFLFLSTSLRCYSSISLLSCPIHTLPLLRMISLNILIIPYKLVLLMSLPSYV